MNRTPVVLSLLGLALFMVGLFLLLRVAMPAPLMPAMGDQYGFDEKNAVNMTVLRYHALPGVFGFYVALAAFGFGIFVAGLSMLLGRLRDR